MKTKIDNHKHVSDKICFLVFGWTVASTGSNNHRELVVDTQLGTTFCSTVFFSVNLFQWYISKFYIICGSNAYLCERNLFEWKISYKIFLTITFFFTLSLYNCSEYSDERLFHRICCTKHILFQMFIRTDNYIKASD